MCTWSGIRWPSSIRLSFCVAKRRRTSPRYGRSWPNKALRRPFGMNTTWYLHSHREWHRLSNSSIVARPSVCLAAHGSERHDGPPNMSNFCCLPGIAGGLPVFIYMRLMLPIYVRRCAHLFPTSRFVVDETRRFIWLPADQEMTVLYPRCSTIFRPVTDPARLELVRRTY